MPYESKNSDTFLKKVAIVTPDFIPDNIGGCGISAGLLVKELRKNNIFVDVFCFGKKQKNLEFRTGNNFYYKGCPNIPLFNNLIALIILFKRINHYDIIHIYNMDLIPVAGFLKKKNQKIFATINNTKGASPSTFIGRRQFINKLNDFLTTFFIKFFRKKVDCYFALTVALKKFYNKNGYKGSEIKIIPNMYDPIFLKPKDFVKKNSDTTEFLYCGQLGEKKGILDLVSAFKEVLKKNKKIKLKIIGSGKMAPTIKKIAEKEINSGFIKIYSKEYSKLPLEYWNSDVFIQPAKWFEPFSRTWLEAMTSGLIIISSDNPSAKEILSRKAYFFKMGSAKSLKALLLNLIIKKNIHGEIFTDNDYNKFSPDNVSKSIIKLYLEKNERML